MNRSNGQFNERFYANDVPEFEIKFTGNPNNDKFVLNVDEIDKIGKNPFLNDCNYSCEYDDEDSTDGTDDCSIDYLESSSDESHSRKAKAAGLVEKVILSCVRHNVHAEKMSGTERVKEVERNDGNTLCGSNQKNYDDDDDGDNLCGSSSEDESQEDQIVVPAKTCKAIKTVETKDPDTDEDDDGIWNKNELPSEKSNNTPNSKKRRKSRRYVYRPAKKKKAS